MQRKTAFGAGIAIWLAVAASAHAACLPNVLPAFTTLAFANGSAQQDCENAPGVESLASGSSNVGNADADGKTRSGFGLDAKADAIYTDPFSGDGFSTATAKAGWRDLFRFAFAGPGPAFLTFTLNLTGSINKSGLGSPLGTVAAGMSFSDQFFHVASTQLSQPGTVMVQLEIVGFGAEEFINAEGDLEADAALSGPGNVMVDFSDTFAVTNIQVLDVSGHVLEDNVILNDDAGNILGAAPNPPPPAVPEPPSALLLAAGLGLLASALVRARPRPTAAGG